MTANSTNQENQSNVLREHIHSSLEKAQVQKNILKRNNYRHTTANIIRSTLAALLAGTAGILGNQAGTWRVTCLLAAVFSASTAASAKIQTAEQLTEASECVGLKALKVETITSNCDWEQVNEKYQQILSEFSTINSIVSLYAI